MMGTPKTSNAIASEMREIVQLLDPYAVNNMGDVTLNDTDAEILYAAVEPTGSVEQEEGDRIVARSSYKVTLRDVDDITVRHALYWNNRKLNIRSVKPPVSGDDRMELLCVEAG